MSRSIFIILLSFFLVSNISIAPISGPEAMAQAGPAIVNFPVSPGTDPDPRNETAIAVSPVNELIMVGASKVIVGGGGPTARGTSNVAYYYSSDGGNTWGSGLIGLDTPQKRWTRATDPSVAADLDGNFYLCALMLDNDAGTFDSGVYVFKSTDGGRTFVNPVPVVFDIGNAANPKQADKCYLTIDTSPTSPRKNTIYVVWTNTDRDAGGVNRTVILTSRRKPDETQFSAPKTISHEGDMRGPALATGPNGEFYAAWQGIGNPRVILFNASTDGGETFFPPVVAPSGDLKIHDYTLSLSPPVPVFSVPGVPRMNSHPAMDVDRSQGPNRGMIYIAWAETTNGTNADVFLKKLTPPGGGRPEVSPAIKLNDDTVGADQFFPWVSVDEMNGAVNVAFYDRRNNPGDLPMDAYLARSTDGGTSFNNLRISTQPSDPRIQSNVEQSPIFSRVGIGDYIGLVATRGKAHLLWTDTRRGKQEIYYGKAVFEPGGGGGGGAPPNDTCQSPRAIAAVPYQDTLDTRQAMTSADDPASCSGGQDSHSVWYAITPAVDTVYGIDTVASDFDTVVSVYTGACVPHARIACSDDFGSSISAANRSMLTFSASAGTTYLIEVSGKGSGGTLRLRLGAPTVTGVEYVKKGPDGEQSLRISGAGFVNGNARVIVVRDGVENELPTITFTGDPQGDGSRTALFASKTKLKKLVKRGRPVTVWVESPAGSSNMSVPFVYTRQ